MFSRSFGVALMLLWMPTFASAAGWLTDSGADDWKSSSSYNVTNINSWTNVGTAPFFIDQVAISGSNILSHGRSTTYPYPAVAALSLTSSPTSWGSTSNVPNSFRSDHTAVIGNYVYFFGGVKSDCDGCAGASYVKSTIYRAPVSNPTAMTDTGSTIPAQIEDSQVAIIGGYVYLFGGFGLSGRVNTIYRASVASPLVWTNTGATLPTALGESQLAVIGDYVYLFGGVTNSGWSNHIYRAPVSDPLMWVDTGATLPVSPAYSQLAVVGDYIYLFVNWDSVSTNPILRAPVSNPLSWVNTGYSLPAGQYSTYAVGQTAVIDNYLYLFSGGFMGGVLSGTIVYRTPLSALSPTCTVWSDTNPIAYGSSTTLRWTSSNATTMYITNIGYVSANATSSTSVGPLASTTYNGTAVNASGTTTCAFTLSVSTPNNCTLDDTTVNHGASATAYQASGVAAGNSCVSESRTCTNGSLSGSYQYASCTVAPTCSLSASPTSVGSGQSTTLTWSSSGASSCSGTNFLGSGTSGSTSVSPSSNTTYTMSCTNAGGSTSCSGTGIGGVGALVSMACAQSWACTGASGQTITQTNADCSTQNLATCDSENGQFCSNGSSQCLALTVTGSLSASPRLIPSGRTSTISWSTTNASSCTVSGNGDTWTGTSGSQTSSTITHRVTYTLVCDDGDADTTQDDFSTTINPYVLPGWFEL